MAYFRPTDLTDALQILAGTGARPLAGGTDVYAATAQRALQGTTLDITAISELAGIGKTSDGWRIGATATWSDIAQTKLPPAFQALQQAAQEVGSIQIQNSGTVAGNLCNASPAADGIPPLLILEAEVEIGALHGTRRVPLSDFIRGVRQVDLRPHELVTAIHIPHAAARGASAFEKLGARKYLVISICMVAVRIEVSTGVIRQAAVSIGACSPVACRLSALENEMLGQGVLDPPNWRPVLKTQVANMLSPIDDIRADAQYRVAAATELVERAIERALVSAAELDRS